MDNDLGLVPTNSPARPDSPSRPDLEGLRKLDAASTPAPWGLYEPSDGTGAAVIRHVRTTSEGARITEWPAVCNCGTLPNTANATLIAEMRNALGPLIAHVERCELALKPFADEAEEYDYGDGSGPDLKDAPDASSLREISNLTVGDLRHARATLSQGTSHE